MNVRLADFLKITATVMNKYDIILVPSSNEEATHRVENNLYRVNKNVIVFSLEDIIDTPIEKVYEKFTGTNMEMEYLPTPKENVIAAMKMFAEQEKRKSAVSFINWTLMGDCEYSATDEDQWTHNLTYENITSEELYDLYLEFLNKPKT